MSDRGRYNKGVSSTGVTYLSRGDWNAWCMRCGRKYKSSQLSKEWDELWVCQDCFEDRHPQDMVRGVRDEQRTPWASPELSDTFALTLPAGGILGLTTTALAPGDEVRWDYNTVNVQVATALQSSDALTVENGANLCAIMNAGGPGQQDTSQQTGRGDETLHPVAPAWELFQYVTATLVSPGVYQLSQLLRGRYGTEAAMQLGTVPAGAPFVFLGQASAANDIWIQNYLGWGDLHWSPVYISGYYNNGDFVFTWVRRSRIPPLWQDDWATVNNQNNFNAPFDDNAEIYSLDVLSASGGVVRTLNSFTGPQVIYPYFLQLADWGTIQPSYTVRVYQVDPILGRGQGRTATVTVTQGTANATLMADTGQALGDQLGNMLIG